MSEAPHSPQSTGALVGRLVRESVRPYLSWLAAAVVCMVLMAAAQALSAWLMKPVVNEVFLERNQGLLWPVGGAVLMTFLVKGIANYGQATLMSMIGQRIITDTQIRLYEHLLRMDISYFHANATGKLISRFTTDINSMRSAVSNALTGFGKDLLSLVGLVIVMFITEWQLAIIAFVVFPIAILPIVRLGRRMRKVTDHTQVQTGEFMTLLEQTFQGIRHVKAYGMEGYEKGRVANIANGIYRLVFKAARVRAVSSPIMESLAGAAIAAVIVYGGLRVIEGVTTPGDFFAFITAALMAYEPVKRLANLNASLQEGLAGADRVFRVLDENPTIVDHEDAAELVIRGGAVMLSDVRFAYDDEGKEALEHVSIDVPAGKTVALVGPSGAGKSTILNLIPRFYDVNDGSVKIDGTDVRDVTLASLRAATALVSQEVTLFDDTVRANIAYGKHDATEDEITTAARNAAADEFIRELPEGYDTVVGEMGVRLSGGQRQRLAIARAMLKNAPILLLDEATSALDTESERKVQAALEELMKGRTTLVIAHRLSTVVNADLIYVIDQGRIAERGTHAELLAANGAYAKLYALQFAGNGENAAEPAPQPA
ncbi:MAG: lipid A export permease/ATP-binding protein MsbA [Rhodospirillales bacterium]|nr:lipid A export permease/ATP-binding protein MsbA [Rhodospirillales bacterium]MCW8862789.1 lipid A export permease/ATP-binding protein MsbA [Rhodospirillales bacterium]MCW8953202.1 lipid A export permease/ATP-binding protein MsbA [Rhodospirillales bacterium]MCW8969815.1 lipid A export permease/ATP-binding protein MsbA [Rhodospirillales bacterium]MCW9002700.1 lipid A export permease/ATP-binding protein MsbA [Rhodospirillales bacterium]